MLRLRLRRVGAEVGVLLLERLHLVRERPDLPLEGRGLRTNEATPLILERENYYSVINGYKDPFLEMPTNGVDRYLQGTAFDDVYRLFCFDRDLRMFMFRYFAIAESTLKSTCAYQFSKVHRDEIEPYLNPANYRAEPNYKGRVTKFVGELSKTLC